MKIIEIIPTLGSGGGERFVVDLCNEMSEEHDVTLVVLHKLEGYCAFYLPQISEKVKVVSMNKKPGLDLKLFWRIFRFVIQVKPDVVHTHLRAIVYSFFASFFVVRGVHTIHSEASKEACEWLSRAARKILFRMRRIIPVTISEDSRKSFENFYGYNAIIIENGRDVDSNMVVSDEVKQEINRLKQFADNRVIIHLAHFYDVKRQDLMARVAKRLYDEGYKFTLLFIGRWDEDSYKKTVEYLMPPCCHILGQRSNPLEYLKEAGAFGLCSKYEGFPISLIEALGVGAIPICTPVGGIVNVVKDGVNGILSSDISEESYYLALKRYLDLSEDEVKKMREKAFESYAPFSMHECARKYVDLYKKLNETK